MLKIIKGYKEFDDDLNTAIKLLTRNTAQSIQVLSYSANLRQTQNERERERDREIGREREKNKKGNIARKWKGYL